MLEKQGENFAADLSKQNPPEEIEEIKKELEQLVSADTPQQPE